MPTITSRVYINNNSSLCIDGVLIPINCELFNPVEYGWFVIASNTIPDGCGGFLEIGTRITENQTVGFAQNDDYRKLLHLVSPSLSYWIGYIGSDDSIDATMEEWIASCKCIPDRTNVIQDFAVAATDESTPIVTFTDKELFRFPRDTQSGTVRASLVTPQTSGALFTIDLLVNGFSVLTTPITFENGEKTSLTAAIQPVITSQIFPNDSVLSCSITQVGSGDAAGLIIYIIA